jgi:serine/threonine protein kinase
MPKASDSDLTIADRPSNGAVRVDSDMGSDLDSTSPMAESYLAPETLVARLGPIADAFFDKLLRLTLLTPHDAERFLEEHRDQLHSYCTADLLAGALIDAGLLTRYQYDRIRAGTTHGLVLGNHKVLDRLGAGGMGVVFLAEHMFLNRREAIKILPVDDDCRPRMLARFYAEMQVLAGLRHPGIVEAYDAGQIPSPSPGLPALLYLAMELVDGGDLEAHVLRNGPVPITQACEWISQACLGLQEAHDRNLIHRDIKPSNLLLTRDQQVKIVDFGLARQLSKRMTEIGTMLGSIDYMPPEQSLDASAVGTAADIYGLGATLFWLLTGEPPYPRVKQLSDALTALRQDPPRTATSLRDDVPPELEAILQSLLDRDPTRRPALPLTVARALLPFTNAGRVQPI